MSQRSRVLFLVVANWACFSLKESKAPFRRTCSMADFSRLREPSPETSLGETLANEIVWPGGADRCFHTRIVRSFREAGASFFETARPPYFRGVMVAAALVGSTDAPPSSFILANRSSQAIRHSRSGNRIRELKIGIEDARICAASSFRFADVTI
jgi:hypothetical protein